MTRGRGCASLHALDGEQLLFSRRKRRLTVAEPAPSRDGHSLASHFPAPYANRRILQHPSRRKRNQPASANTHDVGAASDAQSIVHSSRGLCVRKWGFAMVILDAQSTRRRIHGPSVQQGGAQCQQGSAQGSAQHQPSHQPLAYHHPAVARADLLPISADSRRRSNLK